MIHLTDSPAAIPLIWWVGFNVFILILLGLDLGVFHRKTHAVSVKEALAWSGFWIGLALLFNGWIFLELGSQKAGEFLAGYLIEKSLSVDNIFVFSVLFTYFNVPAPYQHRVLFWGIFGALIMRAIMIAAGAALIANFAWVIYFFAALLVVSGIKMFWSQSGPTDPGKNLAVRALRKIMPISQEYSGQKFFVRSDGRYMATPLFAALVCIELTDLIFAVDSIPAVFAITQDTFIIYTSNVFAILGLRALYFALAGILPYFHLLKYGLGVILIFVGIKMSLAHSPWKISTGFSLAFVAVTLVVSVAASLMKRVGSANNS